MKIRILNITFLLSITFFVINNSIFTQNLNSIKGKVIDAATNTPLGLANISFFGKDLGTAVNDNGEFTLINSIKADSLLITFVGYKSKIIKLEEEHYKTENQFYLEPINISLREITVYSKINTENIEHEISLLSLRSERLGNISSGIPDILRSVQSLPGITANNEFKANFNVRGGNQDENLVLVNNTIVYEPFHIKEAANASVGIFNMDLIKKVDFSTGGFSAQFGDKMSSMLNIQYREGNKNFLQGAASISLAYFDGYLEGPITNDLTFIFGIRKSYLEYILSMINYKEISSAKPSFYDVQGVLSYHISPSNKILFEFIHAGDNFSYEPIKEKYNPPYSGSFQNQDALIINSKTEKETNKASYYSTLLDLQTINILSSQGMLKITLSYYNQLDNEYRLFNREEVQNINIISTNTGYFNNYYTNRLSFDSLIISNIELKTELDYQFFPLLELNLGLSYQRIFYDQVSDDIVTYINKNNLLDPNEVISDTTIEKGEWSSENLLNTKSYKLNGYIENIFFIDDWTLNLGGRFDYFDLNKQLNFSPRFNFSRSIFKNTKLSAAWGYFYQSPNYRQLMYSSPSASNTGSQLAIHYLFGLEHLIYLSEDLSNQLKFRLEGYYKNYKKLISSYFGTFERLTYSRQIDAVGHASGFDFYVSLDLPNFYCWLSYSYLTAKENKSSDNLGEYPRYTDQTHTIAFVSDYILGAGWEVNLRAFYGSGFPYTPKTAVKNNGIWEWKSAEIHSAYLPAYRRIDMRINKNFTFGSSQLIIFLDISNVLNFKNVQGYEYKTPGAAKPEAEEVLLWPIIPSFGVRYKF